MHINDKELFCIYLAALRWAPAWTNHHIIIHSDNQAAVAVINKGTTRSPQVMPFLRHLFWLSATHNFRITAKYIPGLTNVAADAVSRLHQPAKLLEFACLLWGANLSASALNVPLLHHMGFHSALFLSLSYLGTRSGQ